MIQRGQSSAVNRGAVMADRDKVVQALMNAAKACADEVIENGTSSSAAEVGARASAAKDFAEAAKAVHGLTGRGVSAG
jgi:hypothetical protein